MSAYPCSWPGCSQSRHHAEFLCKEHWGRLTPNEQDELQFARKQAEEEPNNLFRRESYGALRFAIIKNAK